MQKTLQRNISLALAGMLLAATTLLPACQASDAEFDNAFGPADRMLASAETRSDGMLMPGSIPQEIVIDTANPADTFTIASLQSATYVGGGTIRYVWHMQTADGWWEIPSSDNVTLMTGAPMAFATVYRREAVSGSRYVYSNECTVYNKSFLDGGAIPDTIHLNKTTFDYKWDIASLREASQPSDSDLEINTGTGWEDFHPSGSPGMNEFMDGPFQHIVKFRQRIVTPAGTAYSNVCTVVNHAFRDDPQAGSDMDVHAIEIGPFGADFTESLVLDTRGEYFWDQDRLTGGGNDAYMNLTLTKPMIVEMITGAAIMMVRTDVWNSDFLSKYFDISSMPYGISGNPIPTFDTYDPARSELIRLDLMPGTYTISIQGSKATNAGMVNGILSISLRGTVSPETAQP